MKWVRVMKEVGDGGTAEGCGVWWCRLVGGKKGVTSFKRKRSINKCVSYVMAWQRLLLVRPPLARKQDNARISAGTEGKES